MEVRQTAYYQQDSMISVDDRVGSIELIPTLQSAAQVIMSAKSKTVPAITSTRLIAGDMCFDGNGPNGKRVGVGVERKRLRDMINSIRTGRYSGSQLPAMTDLYDDCYLVIEGYQRCGPMGELETLITKADGLGESIGGKWVPLVIGQQSFRFTELDHFVCTLERCTGVKVRRTHTEYETAFEVVSLYSHYQTEFDSHHSHQAIHVPQYMATIGKAGLVRKVAACLTGIGWEKSAQVALKFNSVYDMTMAGPAEWATIKPGFGKVLAKRAFDQLRGNYKDPGEL